MFNLFKDEHISKKEIQQIFKKYLKPHGQKYTHKNHMLPDGSIIESILVDSLFGISLAYKDGDEPLIYLDVIYNKTGSISIMPYFYKIVRLDKQKPGMVANFHRFNLNEEKINKDNIEQFIQKLVDKALKHIEDRKPQINEVLLNFIEERNDKQLKRIFQPATRQIIEPLLSLTTEEQFYLHNLFDDKSFYPKQMNDIFIL